MTTETAVNETEDRAKTIPNDVFAKVYFRTVFPNGKKAGPVEASFADFVNNLSDAGYDDAKESSLRVRVSTFRKKLKEEAKKAGKVINLPNFTSTRAKMDIASVLDMFAEDEDESDEDE